MKYFREVFSELLKVANNENIHYCWLVIVIVFGYTPIWWSFFTKPYEYFIKFVSDYDFYSVLIGILAPATCNLLIEFYFEKKLYNVSQFVKLRVILLLVCLLIVFFLTALSQGCYKQNFYVLIPVHVIVIVLSFMCYLSSYLDPNVNSSVNDYVAQEIINKNSLKENSSKVDTINFNGKDITL